MNSGKYLYKAQTSSEKKSTRKKQLKYFNTDFVTLLKEYLNRLNKKEEEKLLNKKKKKNTDVIYNAPKSKGTGIYFQLHLKDSIKTLNMQVTVWIILLKS